METCKDVGVGAEFAVRLKPCVDGGCTENGECREYFSGVFHFSSCSCIAGGFYQGARNGMLAMEKRRSNFVLSWFALKKSAL